MYDQNLGVMQNLVEIGSGHLGGDVTTHTHTHTRFIASGVSVANVVKT